MRRFSAAVLLICSIGLAADTLSEAQLAYAAADVLHLHALKERLDMRLAREGRSELAAACFRKLAPETPETNINSDYGSDDPPDGSDGDDDL